MATVNELGICQAVAAGTLPSGTVWCNSAWTSLRISGTGLAYRTAAGEYVYRSPETWLSSQMIVRAKGLPAILMHPPGGVLSGEEFARRVVGVIAYVWVRADELWGVARLLDLDVAAALAANQWDTSPAVILGDTNAETVIDGKRCLVEGPVRLLDHVAICPQGVWSKGGDPSGVELSEAA
jgi:hypothetical protein